MAIQMRRGQYEQFDPSRLLPGEWAVVLSGDSDASDGRTAYICFAAGDVKRVLTEEDAPQVAQVGSPGIVEPDGETLTVGDDGRMHARDTTYGLAVQGHTLSIVANGGSSQLRLPDDDTTYGLAIDGHTVRLVPGSTSREVTVPDADTTYGLAIDGHTVSLVRNGRTDHVTVPDNDTTYADATPSTHGLMSSSDKRRLDGLDGITWKEL